MSVYTNQTNINATERFDDGSGPITNFTNINVSTINFTPGAGGIITSYTAQEGSPGGVVVGTAAGTQPLTVDQLLFGKGTFGVGQYQLSSWTQTGLTTQGKSTGTFYPNVIRFNSQVDSSTNDTMSIGLLSSIQVATGSSPNGQQINMWGLASTLKSLYPSIVS